MLFEQSAEIEGIVISHSRRNLRYIIVFVFEHIHSIGQAEIYYVLHRRCFCKLLEVLYKPTRRHKVPFGIVFDDNRLVVVFVKIVYGFFDFIKDLGACGFAFCQMSVYHKQKRSDIERKKVLKVCSPQLKLAYHLPEYISIILRTACREKILPF